MTKELHQEWPMPSYMQHWKVFRKMTDECRETARHLLSRKHWPHCSKISICDIGCGDGLLALEIALWNPSKVSEITLIDPDEVFLREANSHLSGISSPPTVRLVQKKAESLSSQEISDSDATLAVHVVYLMLEGTLESILRRTPVGVPTYVVLDEPNSIFSRLWARISPKYLRRATAVHDLMASLPSIDFEVARSTITSHLDNPLVQRSDIKDAVLSLLCYDDVQNLCAEDYEWIEREIRSALAGQTILCESACYEIVRVA